MSTNSGTPPSDVTASTIRIAPASCTSFAISSTGCLRRSTSPRTIATTFAGRTRGSPHLIGREHVAPGSGDRLHVCPVTARHVGQAQAEVAVGAHQHGIARLDHVGDRGLHGRGAGAGNRNRQVVLGLKCVLQQLLGAVHQLDKLRVEVAEQGQRLRKQDARVDRAGAGPHQQPGRNSELGETPGRQ